MTALESARKRLANQRRSAKLYLYRTSTVKPDFSRSQEFQWRAGDIAFLKPTSAFSNLDYQCLVASKHLPINAACHPVIILERRSDDASHVLVTTVSAYGCTARNDSIPPWKQQCHREKDVAAFRSFVGSERPNKDRPLLRLQEGRLMPKPEASWVYLENVFVVPITVLGNFNKAPQRLRMEAADLRDLRAQFSQQSRFSKEIRADCRLMESVNGGTITWNPEPAAQQAPPVSKPVVDPVPATIAWKKAPAAQQAPPIPRSVVAPVPVTIKTGAVPSRVAGQKKTWASVLAPKPVAAAARLITTSEPKSRDIRQHGPTLRLLVR